MTPPPIAAAALVERLGAHPTTALGIDLAAAGGVERWLVAVCVGGGRVPDEVVASAYHALEIAGLGTPGAIAEAGLAATETALLGAEHPQAGVVAARLVRASATLATRFGGSLGRLVGESDSLEMLAGQLRGLAPGFGLASVARFLRPLRDHWTEAREVPLLPGAHAAAMHLGWIGAGEDAEGEPGALRAFLAADPQAPPLSDAEAALERLGRACLRERVSRCPLAGDCPAR